MSLLPFATLAQLPQLLAAIAQSRTFRLTKGDLTAEVTSNSGETWQENLIQSGSLHKGRAWFILVISHFCQSHFCHFRFLMIFASVAVVTMRNGKAKGILEGWGKCDDIEWQRNCIHAGLVEVSLGIISCVEVGIIASCNLYKIFQGFIIFFLRICFRIVKHWISILPESEKCQKKQTGNKNFENPKTKTSA